ncbi:family 16 glycoside hydrolase [Rhizobium mesoamericanum]|uniref:family 16 glycoside hydrolase n=1 Tax=Rhizobium mesoamericanum TaxID=1079800 RepID=UPI00040BAB1B|nr:family 16 glycoside hydrolase [Rhizobium mesoamericanum]
MLKRLQESNPNVLIQDTTLSLDVPGRFICNTWDEAINNGGVQFDAIVIGAGMFGAYCAEKIYRHANLRVLVLEAGPYVVSEHVQNLARIGLNVPGATRAPDNASDPGTQAQVWGIPWRSQVPFPGLAYCVGGRSLYWGGWAPRLTAADLASWPSEVAAYLQSLTGIGDAYEATERETGVFDKTDYISGPLNAELKTKLSAAQPSVATVDLIEDAPLAVQAAPPASGLFSFDKYSSNPILIDAIREDAANPDWRRRLFLVPHAHVTHLSLTNGAVSDLQVWVDGQQKLLSVPPTCMVIFANGTIESTRLALDSFPTPLMGRNLMGHLRSNTVVRIKRSAFDPSLPKQLEAAALLVRGSSPEGRYHLQVTAAAVMGSNSESVMWRMIPDIDLLDQTLASESADWITVTFRGIGEMTGDQDPTLAKVTGTVPNWMDLSDQTDEFGRRRAWVNLVAGADENQLWRSMDDAALALALKLANDDPNAIQYFYKDSFLADGNDPGSWHSQPPPSLNNDPRDPRNKIRDGLGTTHHEAGTLWMGADANNSVTDLDGKFHHVSNAYAVGPAVFPTLGSANPSLTALSLARKTAMAIVSRSLPIEPQFRPLGTGGLNGWRMAGYGGFIELGANIIESVDGIGLLWYMKEQFADFILRLDWRASSPNDNSGIFIRFPALGNTDPANDWKVAVDQGYEIQIDDTGKNPDVEPNTFGDPLHMTGAIYKLAPASTLASKPLGQWNSYEITAQGKTIAVILNGQPVSKLVNANRSPKGYIGLQNHHAGSRVQFRNLRIRTL